jgi:hypothetical protein
MTACTICQGTGSIPLPCPRCNDRGCEDHNGDPRHARPAPTSVTSATAPARRRVPSAAWLWTPPTAGPAALRFWLMGVGLVTGATSRWAALTQADRAKVRAVDTALREGFASVGKHGSLVDRPYLRTDCIDVGGDEWFDRAPSDQLGFGWDNECAGICGV